MRISLSGGAAACFFPIIGKIKGFASWENDIPALGGGDDIRLRWTISCCARRYPRCAWSSGKISVRAKRGYRYPVGRGQFFPNHWEDKRFCFMGKRYPRPGGGDDIRLRRTISCLRQDDIHAARGLRQDIVRAKRGYRYPMGGGQFFPNHWEDKRFCYIGKRYPRPGGRGRYPPAADDILLRKTISTLRVDVNVRDYWFSGKGEGWRCWHRNCRRRARARRRR